MVTVSWMELLLSCLVVLGFKRLLELQLQQKATRELPPPPPQVPPQVVAAVVATRLARVLVNFVRPLEAKHAHLVWYARSHLAEPVAAVPKAEVERDYPADVAQLLQCQSN